MNRTLNTFHDAFWLPSLDVLSDMEQRGILLDTEYLARKLVLAEAEVLELEKKLATWAFDYTRQTREPLNWGSHEQVKAFLYDFKNFPIPPVKGPLSATKKNTKRDRVSCQSALDWLSKNTSDTEQIRVLIQRHSTETLAQFMRKLPTQITPSDGCLRCSIGPNTDTGRLSCKSPNLQQIPVRADKFGIRKAFIARPGHLLVVADYSQLEMYVMAHFLIHHFDDHSLAEALAAGDAHSAMAFRIWGDQLRALGATPETIKDNPVWKKFRDNAKTLNYAVPYGKTAQGLGSQILDANGAPIGKKAAQSVLDDFFEANPGLVQLFDLWRSEARETGSIHTLLGRLRPLPEAGSSDQWARWAAERRAVNTPVQGSAADVVTAAMLACENRLPGHAGAKELRSLGAKLLLQIHDELVFEVPEAQATRACGIIKHIMENPFLKPLAVQLRVDAQVGRTWADAK